MMNFCDALLSYSEVYNLKRNPLGLENIACEKRKIQDTKKGDPKAPCVFSQRNNPYCE